MRQKNKYLSAMCLFGVVGYRCIHSNFIVVVETLGQVRPFYNGNGEIALLVGRTYFFRLRRDICQTSSRNNFIFIANRNNISICVNATKGEGLVGRGDAIKTNRANDCVQSVFLKDFSRDNRPRNGLGWWWKSWQGKCLAENTKPSRRKRQILGKFSRKRHDKAVNFHPQYRLSPRKKGKQARRP